MKSERSNLLPPSTVTKMPTPWLIVIMYSLSILMDWSYAYLVESQPEIIINAWSVLFPIFSYCFLTPSGVALVGIFRRTCWGFGLGYMTIIGGAAMCAISYLLAFKIFPLVHSLFISILVLNLIVILYMIVYAEQHIMNTD